MGHILLTIEFAKNIGKKMEHMKKKLLMAGIMAGFMALGSVPALAATAATDNSHGRQTSQEANVQHQGQPPQMKNGEQPPEPPKDANGNPLPSDGKGMQGQNGAERNGNQPPEPPKDENGNTLPPPDGKGMQGQQNQQKGK